MTLLLLTLVPKAYAMPLAAALMILVGLHISACRERLAGGARRRIRIANGYVALIAIPLLAIGFSVIDPDTHATAWVLVWLCAMALVAMNIGLALLDIVNTARVTRHSRAELRRSLREAIAAAKDARRKASATDRGGHEA
jgi:phosphatidylglycerophosphate synthase